MKVKIVRKSWNAWEVAGQTFEHLLSAYGYARTLTTYTNITIGD